MIKFLQNMVNQAYEIIGDEFGIMDESGTIIACSDEQNIGRNYPQTASFIRSEEKLAAKEGFVFHKILVKNRLEFLIYAKSSHQDALKYLSLFAINFTGLKAYYDEKFDKTAFVRSIIQENIPAGDILAKAKDMHISYNTHRVVFLIKTEKTNNAYAIEIIQELFPNKSRDFVLMLDDGNVILVKEIKIEDEYREIDKIAKTIIDTLNAELMVKAYTGVGLPAENIADICKSYKEAKIALLVGRIFESGKSVFYYNRLGLGRLIYQIPVHMCSLFLKEVFRAGSFEMLDTETMYTIQKFFENNLNVSETSRQLYVHRNTLVYRLDKIQKITGLDIRRFDDAIMFKIAVLVKKYTDMCGKN